MLATKEYYCLGCNTGIKITSNYTNIYSCGAKICNSAYWCNFIEFDKNRSNIVGWGVHFDNTKLYVRSINYIAFNAGPSTVLYDTSGSKPNDVIIKLNEYSEYDPNNISNIFKRLKNLSTFS